MYVGFTSAKGKLRFSFVSREIDQMDRGSWETIRCDVVNTNLKVEYHRRLFGNY